MGRNFLELPLELRLEIYEYTLQDSSELTVGTIRDHSGDRKSNIPGLPDEQIPVLHNDFDSNLLDFTKLDPAGQKSEMTIHNQPPLVLSSSSLSSQTSLDAASSPQFSPYSLLFTCHQIYCEVREQLLRLKDRPLKLHVSYPFGLIALTHLYPALLDMASEVNICGYYSSHRHTVEWAGPVPSREGPYPNGPHLAAETHIRSAEALAKATSLLLGSTAHRLLKNLELRVFFPDPRCYAAAYACDDSPVVVLLQHIFGGDIDLACWKGNTGTAFLIKAKPNSGIRALTTTWPRFWDGDEKWVHLITTGKRKKLRAVPGLMI